MLRRVWRTLRHWIRAPADWFRSRPAFVASLHHRMLREAGLTGTLRAGKPLYVMAVSEPLQDWISRNETWEFIQRERLIPMGHRTTVGVERSAVPDDIHEAGATIHVHAVSDGPYELAHLNFDPARFPFRDFVWRLEVTKETEFQDLSLSFRYQDYSNRLRFRFERGRLSLDRFDQDRRTDDLASVPLKFAAGQVHTVEVRAWEDVFSCAVDGVLRLSHRCAGPRTGSVAITCWDGSRKTDIRAILDNISITELVEGKP